MDLLHELRAATDEYHRRIERLPVSVAMIEGRISRSVYVGLLGELLGVHRQLEAALERHQGPGSLYRSDMARAPLLIGDRAALGSEEPEVGGVVATELREYLEDCADEAPIRLTGALYILEGSRMGSMFLVKPLARALGVPEVPGSGLDYHLLGLPQRPRAWQEFKAGLLGLVLPPAEAREVVHAATVTMRGLHDLYAALSTAELNTVS